MIYWSDVGWLLFFHFGLAAALRWSAPNIVNRSAIKIAPLLIVRDESHRLSLGEFVSTRARLRFSPGVFILRRRGLPVQKFSAKVKPTKSVTHVVACTGVGCGPESAPLFNAD